MCQAGASGFWADALEEHISGDTKARCEPLSDGLADGTLASKDFRHAVWRRAVREIGLCEMVFFH